MSLLFRSFNHVSPLSGSWSAITREWSAWRAARAMAALDDAGLRDLGIGRGEIDDAVRHGRSRRR